MKKQVSPSFNFGEEIKLGGQDAVQGGQGAV